MRDWWDLWDDGWAKRHLAGGSLTPAGPLEGHAHPIRPASVGELAASLAHEINQPLAAIVANVQVARRLLARASIDPAIPAMLQDIGDDAERAARIVRRLRVRLGAPQGERESVDVHAVVKEALALLATDLERRKIRVELTPDPTRARVLGDVVQLQQAIVNVVVNAVEAMSAVPEPRHLQISVAARESEVLTIAVCDSGPGVDHSELERMFDRFVTTKPDRLGMGLPTSRSIVQAHGGRIWATRNHARGLTVHVELPCLEP